MNHEEYCSFDATGLAELVSKGEVSARELAQLAAAGVDKVNPQLNAIIHPLFDEARAAYRRAIGDRSDETAAQSQFMIGETYFHQKRYQEALREFLKVEILYAFPEWRSGALLESAKCHENLHEWSRAAETYSRILEKYPKSTHVAEASERLPMAQKKAMASTSQ